ncbi:hypothetical protein IKW73_01775 [Candidatus Saccharibacteria bacterium]|nr:hypothetical protein [Candidatus Saccharibacteria bacterium]
MKNLTQNSIRIVKGMKVHLPFPYGDEEISAEDLDYTSKSNGTYCVKDSTISYVFEGNLYVTPWTFQNEQTLTLNGFIKEDVPYVPFSREEIPVGQEEKWKELLKKQNEAIYERFTQECLKKADLNCIGELDESILKNCYEMPIGGVFVRAPQGYETIQNPVINVHYFDRIGERMFGKYAYNSGKTAFVYRNGRTYIAKGRGIIPYLEKAGYDEANFYVPLSCGEIILDETERALWDKIKKFA